MLAESPRRAQWRAIIAACMSSGLSVSRWCREYGVDRRRLYYWIVKFRDAEKKDHAEERDHAEKDVDEKKETLSAGRTQWLQLHTDESPALDEAIEVRVGKAVVVVRPGFDPELLANVVRAIELC